MVIDPAKRYVATMVTSHGTMVIALDPLAAPKTVNSFVFLARYHYYDGIVFHRIIPGFVLPGRRPHRHGLGRPRLPFADELPAAGKLPGRLAGHGQRRAQHQRQPVLRHQRARRGRPAARCTRSSARS
jgi:cyclophilin family peptidyl-prolyl cis-trans isomerase